MSTRRVVITGVGVVAPTGITTDTFWKACLDGVSSVSAIPEQWSEYSPLISKLWAPLPEIDYSRFNITRIERMQLDMASVLGLVAARQSIESADLRYQQADEKKNTFTIANIEPSRCGVFIGTGIAGISTFAGSLAKHCFSPVKSILSALEKGDRGPGIRAELEKAYRLMRMPARFNPFSVSMIMPNATSALLGIKYGLTGPHRTFTNACGSGTTAIGHAFLAIQSGCADMALAGGTEYLADDFGSIFRGFDCAKTLVSDCSSPQTANRPFDKKRSGFLFAEGGAAILILESLDRALHRGVSPLAEIAGFAESFDAHSMMAMEPSGIAAERMIDESLRTAGITSGDIDYINAHGTGTQVNDEVESALIERVFGQKPVVNSTKSLIGHTIGAAGAIETAVTALSLRDQTVHGCKNLEDPVRPLNFAFRAAPCAIKYALTHSFAFGGYNAALVLKQAE